MKWSFLFSVLYLDLASYSCFKVLSYILVIFVGGSCDITIQFSSSFFCLASGGFSFTFVVSGDNVFTKTQKYMSICLTI